jgi:hypothetical protein
MEAVPDEIVEIIGCNPLELDSNQRLMVKLQNEQVEFNPSRYMFDNFDEA